MMMMMMKRIKSSFFLHLTVSESQYDSEENSGASTARKEL
jgi:hypothetical protein